MYITLMMFWHRKLRLWPWHCCHSLLQQIWLSVILINLRALVNERVILTVDIGPLVLLAGTPWRYSKHRHVIVIVTARGDTHKSPHVNHALLAVLDCDTSVISSKTWKRTWTISWFKVNYLHENADFNYLAWLSKFPKTQLGMN